MKAKSQERNFQESLLCEQLVDDSRLFSMILFDNSKRATTTFNTIHLQCFYFAIIIIVQSGTAVSSGSRSSSLQSFIDLS